MFLILLCWYTHGCSICNSKSCYICCWLGSGGLSLYMRFIVYFLVTRTCCYMCFAFRYNIPVLVVAVGICSGSGIVTVGVVLGAHKIWAPGIYVILFVMYILFFKFKDKKTFLFSLQYLIYHEYHLLICFVIESIFKSSVDDTFLIGP